MPQTSLQKASVQQPANITKGKPVRPCGFGASHLEPPVRGTVQRHGAGNAPDKDRNNRVGRALMAQAVASRAGFRLNLPGRLAGLIASVAVNEQGRAGPKAHTWPRTVAPTPCERVSDDRAGKKFKKIIPNLTRRGGRDRASFTRDAGLGSVARLSFAPIRAARGALNAAKRAPLLGGAFCRRRRPAGINPPVLAGMANAPITNCRELPAFASTSGPCGFPAVFFANAFRLFMPIQSFCLRTFSNGPTQQLPPGTSLNGSRPCRATSKLIGQALPS
ncbi:hypothetical protein HUJ05_011281 [Dendroctonus ponderosae]|nr:hypothetical protein HUJ05_011281 [Dendroctonus ponderosae]